MMDIKENNNSRKEQMLEKAKADLQWYITEATDEEFDEEEVELLVQVIQKLESQPPLEAQEKEEKLERFRAYVDFYKETENIKTSENKITKKPGKILRFPGKKVVVAAVVCLVLLMIAGSSLGEVNADENTGFFHWLKKDKKGVLAVTSPEKNGIEMNDATIQEYSDIEELPEEYHQYVIEKESISHLQGYEFQGYLCEDVPTFRVMEEIFADSEAENIIKLGVVIYPDRTIILNESFEEYDYLYTNMIGEIGQDVFFRVEESGKKQYLVSFYGDNKKYFVSGHEDVELLEAISEEYMKLVLD